MCRIHGSVSGCDHELVIPPKTFECDLTGSLTAANECEQILQWSLPHIIQKRQELEESVPATLSTLEVFQPESVWQAEIKSMRELVEVEPHAKCKCFFLVQKVDF